MEAQQQAEDAENEVPLYIPPRRKKNVNYTGTVLRKNQSDSDEDSHHPKSKRRKLGAPAHKKRRSVSTGISSFVKTTFP